MWSHQWGWVGIFNLQPWNGNGADPKTQLVAAPVCEELCAGGWSGTTGQRPCAMCWLLELWAVCLNVLWQTSSWTSWPGISGGFTLVSGAAVIVGCLCACCMCTVIVELDLLKAEPCLWHLCDCPCQCPACVCVCASASVCLWVCLCVCLWDKWAALLLVRPADRKPYTVPLCLGRDPPGSQNQLQELGKRESSARAAGDGHPVNTT